MTPSYVAFILTKNWFRQTWAGMENLYYMGCWVNVWNFRKKSFKISTLSFVLFWIPHPKIDKNTNFHKNSVN